MAVYGIDLGTCYSCIARNDGAGSVAPLELLTAGGRAFVPSVVTFDQTTGQPKVGVTGKALLSTKPERTKAFVKREMNREFCESEILIVDAKRKISPVEPSACILKYLVDQANVIVQGEGKPAIHQAVITIPAKFDEKQRARTKLAAEMAGIEVLGLIQEPTAAAIAYDIPAGCTVLVFDLGGGTLDVSIVTNDKGAYKVIGTPAGDGNLGGMDWDEKIVELAFRKIGRRPDRSNQKEWNRFMSMAENIKQALTENESISDDEANGRNIIEDEEIKIERHEFESACKPLLDRCWIVVDKAIENAKREQPGLKIDFFLTVGGSSRMPMIKKGLAAKYGAIYGVGKEESDWLRINKPDTAIAIGAAKYAQLMLSKKSAETNLKTVSDKATHSYGIRILRKTGEDAIKNLIKASEPISRGKEIGDLKLQKNTDSMYLEIFETDSSEEYVNYDAKLHKPINGESINFGKEYPAGTPVKFTINRDNNGLIQLTFQCEKFRKTFEANPSEQLIDAETKEQIENSLRLMDNV